MRVNSSRLFKCLLLCIIICPVPALSNWTCRFTALYKKSEKVDFWEQVNIDFKKNINDSVEVFQHMLQNRIQFQSQIFWLEKIGFKFSLENSVLKIDTPHLKELIKTYNKEMIKSIEAWNKKNPNDLVKQSDIISPKITFYDKKSKEWVVLNFGDAIISPTLSSKLPKVVPGTPLYTALSKGGFPIEVGAKAKDTYISHDVIGHLTSYLENPSYMREYKKLATHIINNYNYKDLWNNHPLLALRILHYNESLVLSSVPRILEHSNLFPYKNLNFRNISEFNKTYKEMSSELASLQPKELLNLAQDFQKVSHLIFIPLGGTSRDATTHVKMPEISNVSDIAMRSLNWNIELTQRNSGDHQRLAIALAKSHWLALQLSQVSPKQWREYILAPSAPSFFFKLFAPQKSNPHHIFNGEMEIDPQHMKVFTSY